MYSNVSMHWMTSLKNMPTTLFEEQLKFITHGCRQWIDHTHGEGKHHHPNQFGDFTHMSAMLKNYAVFWSAMVPQQSHNVTTGCIECNIIYKSATVVLFTCNSYHSQPHFQQNWNQGSDGSNGEDGPSSGVRVSWARYHNVYTELSINMEQVSL